MIEADSNEVAHEASSGERETAVAPTEPSSTGSVSTEPVAIMPVQPEPVSTETVRAEPPFAAGEVDDGGDAIVRVRDVRKVYVHEDKALEVLRGVSLRIRAGEILSIVGPSGAGKSTLLHLIGTLDAPTSGTIFVAGHDVTKMSGARVAALRNETIGFVFQFHHLLPEFTALENVMMPGLIKGGLPRSRLQDMARTLLQQVGLDNRATHRPSELSGGEQQRIALARALVLTPRLLLADEPTGNLDTSNSAHMHELFFKLNEIHGTTMVIVTHNEALAARVPRVVKMRDGQVVDDLRNRPDFAADRLAAAPVTGV